jgi:DNA-binding transcriptional regulator GbsR (MarR family)
MFRVIMDERKKRECDPTMQLLKELTADKRSDDPYIRDRLSDMRSFFELMTQWYDQTRQIPTPAVMKLCKMGEKVAKLVGVT